MRCKLLFITCPSVNSGCSFFMILMNVLNFSRFSCRFSPIPLKSPKMIREQFSRKFFEMSLPMVEYLYGMLKSLLFMAVMMFLIWLKWTSFDGCVSKLYGSISTNWIDANLHGKS